jgi:sporulation protein YlmC with PRC-barrel domain
MMWTRSLIGAAVALALAGPAAAQTAPSAPGSSQTKPAAPPPATSAASFLTAQLHNQKITGELIGMSVANSQGETVGRIVNLVLDQDHRVVGAVMSVGGFLGLGGKSVAVPWKAVRIEKKNSKGVAVLDMTSEELANAPEFKTLAQIRAEQEAQAQRAQQERKQRTLPPPTRGGGTNQ